MQYISRVSLFVGGGVALLYASRELDKLVTENFDQRIGVQIVQNALKVAIPYQMWIFISMYKFGCLNHMIIQKFI